MPETGFYIQRNVWHLQYHKYIGTQKQRRGGGKNISEECSRLPTKRESSAGGMSSGQEWTIRKIKYMQRETESDSRQRTFHMTLLIHRKVRRYFIAAGRQNNSAVSLLALLHRRESNMHY
jgi:hypothetical protein